MIGDNAWLSTEDAYITSEEGFLYPQYGRRCISDLPNSILNLFDVVVQKTNSQVEECIKRGEYKPADNIVLIVIDGFGFNQFLRHYRKHKFFINMLAKGEVFSLTSVFPSQTTNALTTLNTGLLPQEHSLFEYFIYLKEAGVTIDTLWFEHINGRRKIKLLDKGFNATVLFSGKTIHETLNENGITTFAHIPAVSAYSVCSSLIFKGSTIMPSVKISDTIVGLRRNLKESKRPAYFFVHLDTLDTIAHAHGPYSYEYEAELSRIAYILNRELVEKIDPETASKTLLLVTADHGAVNVDPHETFYLNSIPSVLGNLKYGENGKRILPVGSPRDVFLHVREEKLEETRDLLSSMLAEKAKVIEVEKAIRMGLFGLGYASERFLERAGNLLILPYRNETIWVDCSEGRKANFAGHHGGLNKEEMLVPFAIAKLDSLQNS